MSLIHILHILIEPNYKTRGAPATSLCVHGNAEQSPKCSSPWISRGKVLKLNSRALSVVFNYYKGQVIGK